MNAKPPRSQGKNRQGKKKPVQFLFLADFSWPLGGLAFTSFFHATGWNQMKPNATICTIVKSAKTNPPRLVRLVWPQAARCAKQSHFKANQSHLKMPLARRKRGFAPLGASRKLTKQTQRGGHVAYDGCILTHREGAPHGS